MNCYLLRLAIDALLLVSASAFTLCEAHAGVHFEVLKSFPFSTYATPEAVTHGRDGFLYGITSGEEPMASGLSSK